jgi:hypothetical protein
MTVRKILILNFDGLSDALMLTATVRDIVKASPGSHLIDVYTSGMPLWLYNQNIARLDWRAVPYDGESELASNEYAIPALKQKIICYDTEILLIHTSKYGYFPSSENLSNTNAYHMIHSYAQDVGKKMGLSSPVPIGEQKGEIFFSDMELSWISQIEETGNFNPIWIVSTGGPETKSAKWWDLIRYQKIIDEFKGKITFVQCGLAEEHNPRLRGVIDLVGKTDLRKLIRLMYHAVGYLGTPGFLMHLAAATPAPRFDRKGRARPHYRAAVIVAGGREASQWLAYEGQQLLHTNGMLPCCQTGGCGKTRCEKKHPLDPHPEQLCSLPIYIDRETMIPKCLDMISTSMVIDRLKFYYDGGTLYYDDYVSPKELETKKAGEEKKVSEEKEKNLENTK